jgi:hypothetical protein
MIWLDDLKSHEPCPDGYRWAKENNIASLAEAFAKLERSDWWLWLARAYGIDLDKPRLVTFAADCAERVLPKFEERYPADKRPREAIEAARAWVTCPSPETRATATAADAAAYAATATAAYADADAAAYAAAYAADAAANAAAAAANATAAYAAYAAADADAAAYANAYAAAYAADAAAAAAAANATAAAYAADDADAAADAAAERSWQADRLRELFPEVTK